MAKTFYCWRCQEDVPMFDEQEWERIGPALTKSIETLVGYRRDYGLSLEEARTLPWSRDLLHLHYEMTGQKADPDALWHHRLALHGPPCAACGKPLRTPRASFCAACGTPVAAG